MKSTRVFGIYYHKLDYSNCKYKIFFFALVVFSLTIFLYYVLRSLSLFPQENKYNSKLNNSSLLSQT